MNTQIIKLDLSYGLENIHFISTYMDHPKLQQQPQITLDLKTYRKKKKLDNARATTMQNSMGA